MKQSMIRHFLSLHKNGGNMIKSHLNENEVALCDGYFFFIQDKSKMVLNENLFKEKLFKENEENVFLKTISDKEYEEARIVCYIPTYRKNKFTALIKNDNTKVILNKDFLDLFDYEKIEIKDKKEIVRVYDSKGNMLGGILPMRCDDSAYEI